MSQKFLISIQQLLIKIDFFPLYYSQHMTEFCTHPVKKGICGYKLINNKCQSSKHTPQPDICQHRDSIDNLICGKPKCIIHSVVQSKRIRKPAVKFNNNGPTYSQYNAHRHVSYKLKTPRDKERKARSKERLAKSRLRRKQQQIDQQCADSTNLLTETNPKLFHERQLTLSSQLISPTSIVIYTDMLQRELLTINPTILHIQSLDEPTQSTYVDPAPFDYQFYYSDSILYDPFKIMEMSSCHNI